jgi:hypothetical protein
MGLIAQLLTLDVRLSVENWVRVCRYKLRQTPFRSVIYEGVPKSFRTGRLKREVQMVQLYRNFVSQSSELPP